MVPPENEPEDFVYSRPSLLDESLWACETSQLWAYIWSTFKWSLTAFALGEVTYLSWYHFSSAEICLSTGICILCLCMWRLPNG